MTKLPEVSSKPTRLHFMNDNDLDVRVECENVKEIFIKDLIFEVPSIELRTVFQIL